MRWRKVRRGGGKANSQRFVVAKRWHLCLRSGGGAKCLSFTAKRNCALSRKKAPGRAKIFLDNPSSTGPKWQQETPNSHNHLFVGGGGDRPPLPPRRNFHAPGGAILRKPSSALCPSAAIPKDLFASLSLSAVFGTIRPILFPPFRSISEFPNLAPPIAIHCDTNGQMWATRGQTNRRNRSNTFVKKDIQLSYQSLALITFNFDHLFH